MSGAIPGPTENRTDGSTIQSERLFNLALQSEAQDNSASSSEEASDPRSPTSTYSTDLRQFRQMEVNPPCSGIRRPNRSSNHDGSQVERHGWGMFASAYPLTVRGGPTGSANRMRQGKARAHDYFSQPSIPSRVENLAACILYFRTDPADRYALLSTNSQGWL
ncbi:hypothetical protein CIHG_00341 [Coccidioides immitis H538.4]|uniref:Uncharacterized protein n=3 Tax=Coccidioides immitis TaxID=5501 RepID=A0A0J8QI15_COCIT|nr:hypothetical protein CIRG_07162 [Coccidioides immitis RMSCC 2394]KMU72070.1 hypothetical protein CISG_00379 [Coccidioides immitis RMSCC 3703]KMU82560.1 hypothetical protein CIHG_00341 [Coccidioides immitis H538.4]